MLNSPLGQSGFFGEEVQAIVSAPESISVNGYASRVVINSVEYEHEEINLSRKLKTFVPDTVSTVLGSATASATVVINGPQYMSTHPAFSGSTNLVGLPAYIEVAGGSGVYRRIITGVVSKTSHGGLLPGGRATIEILDYSELLHGRVTLPACGTGSTIEKNPRAYRIGADQIGIIAHCLNATGYRVSPLPVDNYTVFSSPNIGGLIPDSGSIGAWDSGSSFVQADGVSLVNSALQVEGAYGPQWGAGWARQITFKPEPYVTIPGSSTKYLTRFPTAYVGNATWQISMLVNFTNGGLSSNSFTLLVGLRADSDAYPVSATAYDSDSLASGAGGAYPGFRCYARRDGAIRFEIIGASGARTGIQMSPPQDGMPDGYHLVVFSFLWYPTAANPQDTQIFTDMRRSNGDGTTSVLYSGGTLAPPARPCSVMEGIVNASVRFQSLRISHGPWGQLYSGSFAVVPASVYLYPAQLEPLNHAVFVMPERTDADAWDVISEVAEATGATVDWTPNGEFRVRSFSTMQQLANSGPSRVYVIDRDFADGGEWITENSNRRNSVKAVVKNQFFAKYPTYTTASPPVLMGDNETYGYRWDEVIEIPLTIGTYRYKKTMSEPALVGCGTLPILSHGYREDYNRYRARKIGFVVMTHSPNGGVGLTSISPPVDAPVYGEWGSLRYRQTSPTELEIDVEITTIRNPLPSQTNNGYFTAYPKTWTEQPPLGNDPTSEDFKGGSSGMVFGGWRYANPFDFTIVATQGTISALQENVLELDDNDFRQEPAATTNVMLAILNSLNQGSPTGTRVTLTVGDPTIDIGEKILMTASSPALGVGDIEAQVVGIEHRISAERGFETQLFIVAM